MLNIEKVKNEFNQYVKNYEGNAEITRNIELKREHSLRVPYLSKRIAEEIKLNDEDIKLAELIGLLHDIGRFEQLRRYKTFNDSKSIDHAALGVEILKENNFIERFCDDNKLYDLILVAIYNHNKFKIAENTSNKRILTHCKIIRDADKIDILNLMRTKKIEDFYYAENFAEQPITQEVYEGLLNEQQVSRSIAKTNMDDFLNSLSFVFDINYVESLKILRYEQYIDHLADRIIGITTEDNQKKIDEIRKNINNYMDRKINNSDVAS